MALYLLLQDGESLILLQDGSGALLLQAEPPPMPRLVSALAAAIVRTAQASTLSRFAAASVVTRVALGGYPVPVTAQSLDTIFQGEDITIRFRIATDPTGWAMKFTLIPSAGNSVVTTSLTVSGSSPAWYIAVTINSATTAALATGVGRVQLHRTDTGSAELLATGSVMIADPPADIP